MENKTNKQGRIDMEINVTNQPRCRIRAETTYKQVEYLKSFENIEFACSASQMVLRMTAAQASAAIDAAKRGERVRIW